jgi:hypothetical protein
MATREPTWSERIRDLIEEVDRVRRESERTRDYAERAMKEKFWPERRREPRFPSAERPGDHHRGA